MKRLIPAAFSIFGASLLISSSALSQSGQRVDFQEAQVLNSPKPEYPNLAKDAGFGGTVRIRVRIEKSGKPSIEEIFGPDFVCGNSVDARVVVLREAAKEAVLQAQFAPAMKKGRPVESTILWSYNFGGFSELWMFRQVRSADGSPNDGNVHIVLNGQAVKLVRPEYSDLNAALKIGGLVEIETVLDENGNVLAARMLSGNPRLKPAAIRAACESKFSRTVAQGKPIMVVGKIEYNFENDTDRRVKW